MKKVTAFVGTASKKATYYAARQFLNNLEVMGDVDVEMVRLGESLCGSRVRAMGAYVRAKTAQARETRRKARTQRALSRGHADGPRILVVGHPYNLHDELMGAPIVSYLESLGVQVLLSDAVPPARAHALSKRLSRGLYWTYNKELLGAVERYRREVDGIVFLVTFPCGPDSLVTELCTRRISEPPILNLVIDELQAEAGLRTRLESFVDIMRMRREGPVAEHAGLAGVAS